MGDRVAISSLASGLVSKAQDKVKGLLAVAIDAAKISPEPLHVLLVAGGAALAPDSLEDASELKRPPFHDVANAVGAAISKIGGVVDIVQGVADQSVLQAGEHAKRLAESIAREVGGTKSAKILLRGKIVNVDRRLSKGHSYMGVTHITDGGALRPMRSRSQEVVEFGLDPEGRTGSQWSGWRRE